MTGTGASTRTRLWAWITAGLLVALLAAAAVPLTLDAARVVRTHTTTRLLGEPVDAVVVQLQEERRLSAGYLADVVERDALTAQRRRTDDACLRLQEAAAGSMWRMPTGAHTARLMDDLVRRLDERSALRSTVDAQGSDADAVVTGYTGIITAAFAGAPWLWPDRRTGSGSALLTLGRAREALSQQDAALIGDPRGAGTAQVRATVVRLAMTRRVLLAEAADELPDTARRGYEALAAEPATARLLAWEDRLLATAPAKGSGDDPAKGGVTAPGKGSGDAPGAVLDAYRTRRREVEVEGVRQAREQATPDAVVTVGGAGLLAGVGLVAVIAVLVRLRRSVALSGRTGAATASSAARAGDGHVLEVALEQNRRNQALLHRLLRMLDHLQRRVGDESILSELFRIDHFASRVRRNVEKTISLTGGTPGRRWTAPVPLTEVVRAAAAEVPGFERVSTAQVEPAALTGTVAVDVMHLLAELIENAVTFSPAETRVRVGGQWVDDRYVLTVADHGPGMTGEDLRVAADVLAATTPPATRAWDGLYATGRLADRCGIEVQLSNGDAGGLLAEVTVPTSLLAGLPEEHSKSPSEASTPGDGGPWDRAADELGGGAMPWDRAAGEPGDDAGSRDRGDREPGTSVTQTRGGQEAGTAPPRVPRPRTPQRLRPGAAITTAGPDE